MDTPLKKNWFGITELKVPVITPKIRFVVVARLGLPVIVPAIIPEITHAVEVPVVSPVKTRTSRLPSQPVPVTQEEQPAPKTTTAPITTPKS